MSVVVGWISSDAGRTALQHAVQEAGRRSTDLVVLGTRPGSAEEAELRADVELLRASSGVEVSIRHLTGDRDAAEELIDVSFEEETEVIVLGIRRRSPVGKLLLGSTSQRVLLEAQCPVTAVKPPLPA
ncbi:universal stress protein [Kineococcus sp. SYSU DK003]|uniref:universal stress protein n=1 Tax=Kineococcus sp. SYSU DK003 TaxID=3383124 RepID=UPI003D7C37A4